jgi:hypothetical protein
MNLQLPTRISSADLVPFEYKEQMVIRQMWVHGEKIL